MKSKIKKKRRKRKNFNNLDHFHPLVFEEFIQNKAKHMILLTLTILIGLYKESFSKIQINFRDGMIATVSLCMESIKDLILQLNCYTYTLLSQNINILGPQIFIKSEQAHN